MIGIFTLKLKKDNDYSLTHKTETTLQLKV